MTRRVLLILDDCGAGDAVRLGYCVRAVRESLPGAQMTLVVGEEAAAPYRGSPLVDRVVVSRLYSRPSPGRFGKLLELGRLASATGVGYDLVIVFWWGSTLLRLLARLAGRGRRIGYAGRFGWLLSSRLGGYDFGGDEIAQNSRLLTVAEIGGADRPVPVIAVSEDDAARAEAALSQAGWDGIHPLVLLHPGSDWACQQWPVSRWAALADGLAMSGPAHLVFTGTAKENKLVESIRGAMSRPSGSLAGKVSLTQLGAVLQRASLLVTVDSAAYVVARAQGTPTVVLAGPSHPERVDGLGSAPLIVKKMDAEMEQRINDCKRPRYPAGGCQDWTCPMAGMREIGVPDVLKAARSTLRLGGRHTPGTSAQVSDPNPRATPGSAIAEFPAQVLTGKVVDSDLVKATAGAAAAPRRSGAGVLLKNILVLAGGTMASWAFGLLWLVFVPRALGPAPIGEFVIALAITAVLGNVINQGAGTLLTREIARDHGQTSSLVAGALVMRLACILPAFLLMVVYIRLLGFGAEQSLIIFLATGVTVAASLSGAVQAAFTGLERMEYLAYGGLVGNALVSLLGIALVLLGGRIIALLVLDLSLTILILGLNLYWSRHLFQIAWREGARRIPYIVRAGLSYWIGGLFFTTYLWIDSVILSALAPVTVIGWYGVPIQLFTAVLMVAGVLATAWFPRLAAAHVEGTTQLQQVGRPAVEAAIVLSLPIAAGLALVSGPMIHLLYGPRFSGAEPVLAVLAISVVPTFFNMLAYQVLLAQGRQVAWIKVVAVATFLNVAANLVLIPLFQAHGNGAVGAALSLLGTEVFESVGALVLLPWLLHARLLGRVARAALATACMSLAVVAVAPLGLIAQILTGLAAFAVLAFILRLPTHDEIAELRGLGERLPRKLGFGRAAA